MTNQPSEKMKNNRDAVHRIHCGISDLDGEKEYPPTCKYGDEDCPVVLEYKTIPESVIIPREELEKIIKAFDKAGAWMSAALSCDETCKECKDDFNAALVALEVLEKIGEQK